MDPRPRVLHLIHHLSIGGAERMLVELAPRLADAGFDVAVACLSARGPLSANLSAAGIPVHDLGKRPGFDAGAVRRLRNLLRGERIDVLNTHDFSASLWGRLGGVLAGVRGIVSTMHAVAGWHNPRKHRVLNRPLGLVTDRIVAVSEAVKRSLVEREGADPRRIVVIHNGIAVRHYAAGPARAEARAALNVEPAAKLAGMIARCSPVKGGEVFIKALASPEARARDVRGVIVGDGPARDRWRALATALGIADRVSFPGWCGDPRVWLAALDVAVCPSHQESFGLAAVEAQAAGRPVVATRVDGLAEVLHDGQDALLVPRDDPPDLAAAILSVLEKPALAARLGAAGRRNAERNYSIERTVQGYSSLYRQVLSEHARRRRWPLPRCPDSKRRDA